MAKRIPLSDPRAIAEELHSRRRSSGKTLEEVASAAGTNASKLSRVERGKGELRDAELAGVCKALGINVFLLFEEGNQDVA